MIEDSQPFYNDISNAGDFEEIGDIRQSHHYVWVMDQTRTRLVRAPRNKMTKKLWVDVLLPLENYKKNDEGIRFTKNQLITAWGVSNDELLRDQWVCLFVSDLDNFQESYFVFFKVTIPIKVPVFGTFDDLNRNIPKILAVDEQDSLFYLKVKSPFNMNGSLYFKMNKEQSLIEANKDKNIYTLYGCSYAQGSGNINSRIERISFDMKGKKQEGEESSIQQITDIKEFIQGENLKTNIIYEYLHIYGNLLFSLAKTYRDPSKEGGDTTSMEAEFNIVLRHFNITDAVIADYFSNKSKNVDELQKNRFEIYKLFARMLHYLAKSRYLSGYLDIKVDYAKKN